MSAQLGRDRDRSTALIVAGAGLGHSLLRDGLGLGRCSITVRHPLEVIRCLQDESRSIVTVFCPVDDPAFKTAGLLAFLGDEFPLVRRIGYARDGAVHPVWPTSGPHDLALRATSAKLDGRVRVRIGELAAAMGFSAEDAEDIVQDTMVGLFLGRGTSPEVDTDTWVAALTAKTASNRERGNQRRSRLRVAAASEAATCRSSRESTGRPDAALLTAELADLASTTIRGLPGQCRRPFQLRVLEDRSARSSGAALGMLPSTVEMWLAHARQRIGVVMHPHLA